MTIDSPLTGLVVAMQEELALVLEQLTQARQKTIAGLSFHQGLLSGQPVVAVVCGVGKVNAALCTQLLITEFQVQQIINIGIAGGLDPELMPGDVEIADSLTDYDIDVHCPGWSLGLIYTMPSSDS